MSLVLAVIAAIIVIFLILSRASRRARSLFFAAQRAAKARDFAAAARLCRECRKLASKVPEPHRSRLEAAVEVLWATVLYRQGRMAEAEDLFRRGFSKSRAAGCPAQLAPAYLDWGGLCTDQGRHPEAERLYQTALEKDEHAGNLAGMIFDLQRLGDSLIRQGRRSEAEETLNRSIALETQVVYEQMLRQGKDPAGHTVVSWSLPDLHFCREQYEDARRLYRAKVEFWEKTVTRPDNIDLGHLQMRLALSEARSGHHAEALEMYTRAELTFEREWGAGHPKTAAAREAIAAMSRESVGALE